MPHKSGLDICKELTDSGCPTRIIILTMYKDIEMQKLAFFNGAKGYLVKDNTSEELVDAIAAVLDGKTFLSRGLTDHQLPEESTPQQMKVAEQLSNLTRTELKTLKLVSQKRSSKEIADLLFVSAKSVENYRSRICKKLHLDARNNSLLLWVLENKSVIDRLI
jgi:DNA-binding NarL/FixJ family response regulator